MNKITENLNCMLSPVTALVFYGTPDASYVERRDIIDGRMGVGTPLTEECLSSLLSLFREKEYYESECKQLKGALPSNLLYLDTRVSNPVLIWYRLPERRYFYSKSLGIENGEIQTTGMIYKVVGDRLYVYAFKGDKKPTNRTVLYAAPYFNIDAKGLVCLGSAKNVERKEDSSFAGRMEYFESLFWGSEFTHLGTSKNPTKSNLVNVIRRCITTKCGFPAEELKPMKIGKSFLKLQNIL